MHKPADRDGDAGDADADDDLVASSKPGVAPDLPEAARSQPPGEGSLALKHKKSGDGIKKKKDGKGNGAIIADAEQVVSPGGTTTTSGNDDEDEDEEDESEEEEDEEDEEEDESEEEEADDEEPQLKYQRLAGTLGETLKKDAVSCMAVCDRFLALGTHWGIVHILDLNGNDVKRFECHSATINEVSIDTQGEFVASAGDDGKIVINSLYTTESWPHKHRRPMKSIALEPDYSRKTTRQFACGGTAEELLLCGKGWFASRDVVLHSGEGPVYSVKWRKDYIAWANEADNLAPISLSPSRFPPAPSDFPIIFQGVKVYDVVAQQKFAYIDRPEGSPRADLFRCNLCWKEDDTLLIGWADSVKVGVVKERNKMDVASGLSGKYVEIVCQFRTDFIVCGIAPFQSTLVLLSFMADLDEHRNVDNPTPVSSTAQLSSPPEIHIVDMHGEHVANDVLSLFGYEHYRANDYRLEFLPNDTPLESTFYIVSPKDIVVAKPRDVDDHIEWLVERARYEEALAAAESSAGSPTTVGRSRLSVSDVVEIGIKYLNSLMAEGKYEQSAKMLAKILRGDARLWEEWIFQFSEVNKLAEVVPHIPTKEPVLSSAVYEMVLANFLREDLAGFVNLINTWPPEIYTVHNVAEAVGLLLDRRPMDPLLLEAGLELYAHDKRHDRSLLCGLRLGRPDILRLVRSHNLFKTLEENVQLVLRYDERRIREGLEVDISNAFGWREGEVVVGDVAETRRMGCAEGVGILVSNTDRIPVSHVVDALRRDERFLFVYLDALMRREGGAGAGEGLVYHNEMVRLFADYDPGRLLDFLRVSAAYDVGKAYVLCEERDLVGEMVYLLGKMGDNRRALALVIERLGDVKRAIEFAKEQNDEGLWEDLLKYSMDKPPFIVGLLENLGSYIDPIKLIRRIPNGLAIPGLRDALIKVLTDYGVQMSLKEGCQRILVNDTVELQENIYRQQRRGMRITGGMMCNICESQTDAEEMDQSFVFFFCRHTFHKTCLEESAASKAHGNLVSSSSSLTNPSSPSTTTAPPSRHQSHHLDTAIRALYRSGGGAALPGTLSLHDAGAGGDFGVSGGTMRGIDSLGVDPFPDLTGGGPVGVKNVMDWFECAGRGGSDGMRVEGRGSGGWMCPICRSGKGPEKGKEKEVGSSLGVLGGEGMGSDEKLIGPTMASAAIASGVSGLGAMGGLLNAFV
ncbi:Vacuolar protein sorting-associated protein 41 [Irineochytrium annulatum]|nr:Vacuolar protein sorting-associated protein 41 [Irineochytrium annulatum]